jgi:hypothetical protein
MAPLLLAIGAVLAIAPACTAAEQPVPDPLLVLEMPGSKSDAVDLVVVDLSGRELLRQSTGAAEGSALTTLHPATAQVAFWRAAGAGHELVVWNIATKVLKVIATSATPPAVGPLWSLDGTEVVSLTTTTPISWAPGSVFDGKAEISVASVSGQVRTLAIDHPFIPALANGTIVAGESFSGEKRYTAADVRSGRTLSEFALTAVGILPTANPDVVIALRETSTVGEVTLHAMNARTGADLSPLGQVYAQPLRSWPGRNEVVFVDAGELKAFDYVAISTRVVGRFAGANYALGFDPLGRVLLATRLADPPVVGTFALADGRITSAMRDIPLSSFGLPLGLVRIKV